MLGKGIAQALLDASGRLDSLVSRGAGHYAHTVGGDHVGARAVEAAARVHVAADRANIAPPQRLPASSGPPAFEVVRDSEPSESRRGPDAGTQRVGVRAGVEHPGDFMVTLPHGARLQCRAEGPEDGVPIFQLHGSPGSRVDTAPSELLDRVGVRLITFDRPGYGGSDPQEGIDVASGALHIQAIADHLGIDKFAVVGRSGGAAYAAAAAARLPDRVTRLALLVPNAPPALMKDRYNVGTTQQPTTSRPLEEIRAQRRADLFANPTDPMTVIGIPHDRLGEVDQQIVDKHAEDLCASYIEALREGTAGWDGDMARKNNEWGFEFTEIRCPTLIWTASGDGFTPPAYAEKIAEQLPPGQGRLYMVPDTEVGHFGGMEIKPGTYAWLSGQENLTRFPPGPGSPLGMPIATTLDQWSSLIDPR